MGLSGLIKAVTAVGLSLVAAGCSMRDATNGTDATVKVNVSEQAVQKLSRAVNPIEIFGEKVTTKITGQPIGAFNFCREDKANCPSLDNLRKEFAMSSQPVDLNGLSILNMDVNTAYEAAEDIDIYNVDEKWTYPDPYIALADCEDYALEKRRRLLEQGVQPESLSIAVVLQANGDGHAILLAQVDKDIFILDNLQDEVITFAEAADKYTFVKWSNDLNKWYKFEDYDSKIKLAAAAP